MGKHPSLVEGNDSRSDWEQRDRDSYRAPELLKDYREALYTDKGLELIRQEPSD